MGCGTDFVDDAVIRAEEQRQGWQHMPCGKHGAAQDARLVVFMSQDTAAWEVCEHVNPNHAHGGKLPTIRELIAMRARMLEEEPDTPLADLIQVVKAKRNAPAFHGAKFVEPIAVPA